MLQLALPFPAPLPHLPLATANRQAPCSTTVTIFRLFRHRSLETAEHVVTMGVLVEKLARLIGLQPRVAARMGLAAQLHDVGKMGIPDTILNKPGRLTPAEYDTMKHHTLLGREILAHSGQPLLDCAAIIAHQHHERWDGLGYPRRLSGEDIHLYGRVATICDVFDALSRDRVYRKAWLPDQVFAHLEHQREKAFDPLLLDVFLDHFDAFMDLRQGTNLAAPLVCKEAAS